MIQRLFPHGWEIQLPRTRVWPRALWILPLVFLSHMGIGEAMESREFVLENGLRAILVVEPKAPVVVTQVWYRVGATDELPGKTGLAHMLEHMMFQGTQKIPAGEYSRIIARHGGEENASTAWDYTNYWTKLSSDHLDLALELEADRMRNLKLTEKEFNSENLVVREERRMRTDSNPQARFHEKFMAFFFQNHPYGRPVIGSMKDIQNHTLADLKVWYDHHYTPDNAIVVMVGDFKPEEAERGIRTHFGPMAPGNRKPRATLPPFEQEKKEIRRFRLQDKAVSEADLRIYYPSPSFTYGDVRDVLALDLLSTILGGGNSSRLYRRLVVEKEVAISAYASYGGFSRGVETFSLGANPREGETVEKLEQLLLEEVDRLIAAPVEETELQRAKNGLLANRIFDRDSIDHMASIIGRMSVNGADWHLMLEKYSQEIQKISAARIQEVAARYLTRDHATIGILTP